MNDSGSTRANVDARRALGIRPGGLPPPRLQIDGEAFDTVPQSPIASSAYPPSPTSRNVSISIPHPGPPSPRLPPSPSSPSTQRRLRRPTISRAKKSLASLPVSSSVDRGRYETQKLLSHLLSRLEARDHAPDLLERAAISAREVSGKGKVKARSRVGKLGHAVVSAAAQSGVTIGHGLANGQSGPGQGVGNDDLEERLVLQEGDWDTEEVCDLVEQTRGLLLLANRQGLDLFADSGGSVREGESTTPAKQKRKAGRFSSIASPTSPSRTVFPGEAPSSSSSSAVSGGRLLARVLSLLRSLITVDCLHRTHLFSPLRPPNFLQAACLDIATYLYYTGDSETKVDALDCVVDGLYAMGEGMTERICEWLESRFGQMLGRLSTERGGGPGREKQEFIDPFFHPSSDQPPVPTFAISTDTPDEPSSQAASTPGWKRFSPTNQHFPFFPAPDELPGILSTHTPSLSAELSSLSLRISGLVPRLLLAITSILDLSQSKLTTIHRFHRLLSLVLTAKPDSALDLLEIVAHAPDPPRRTALEILATFFPQTMGHNTVARRLASTTYSAQRTKWETGQDRVLGEDEIEQHHYVPWRISSRDAGATGIEAICMTCEAAVHGFCVRCTLCRDIRHLHCYRPKYDMFSYDVVTLSSRDAAPQTVYVKFSRAIPRLEEKVLDGTTAKGDARSTRRRIGQHDLHLVNLFNLTLCGECGLPLWGATAQALACLNGCQRFFHPECVNNMANTSRAACKSGRDVMVDEISTHGKDPFAIAKDVLLRSFESSCQGVVMSDVEVAKRSFDEIAVLYGAVWTHHQLLKNGLGSGSVRILADGAERRKVDNDPLGLRKTLKQYEEFLRLNDHQASTAASDFAHVFGLPQAPGEGYCFSELYLAYCTALLRAPSTQNHSEVPSGGLLTAQGLPALDEAVDPNSDHSVYELLPLPILRRTLASDLSIRDPRAAAFFVDQLRSTGLCVVANAQRIDCADLQDEDKWVSFSLPLLMDSSPTVELLISSIEVLLDDLDLTMVEQGFQLLATRAWPSLLCSPYALERFGSAIVAWVMAQEDSLMQIVTQYASKHRRLPGVRPAQGGGPIAKGNSSVSLYQEAQTEILRRYAQPWLNALHDQDNAAYAHILYEQCKSPSGLPAAPEADFGKAASRIARIALDRMAAVVDGGVVFSTLMDLLIAWLEDLGGLAERDDIYKALPRLLKYDEYRRDRPVDAPSLWSLAEATSSEDSEGYRRVCRWMRVLGFSGVDIPWSNLTALVDQQASLSGDSIEAQLDLVIAVHANGSAIDPAEFASIAGRMLITFSNNLTSTSPAQSGSPQELELLRQVLLINLRACGVPLDDVATTSLATEEMKDKQPASLAKRRRMTHMQTAIEIDKAMVLAGATLLQMSRFPPTMLLDFCWLLFTRVHAVGNIEAFLYKVAQELYPIFWPTIDIDVDRRCRARVLLRLLSINPTPLVDLLEAELGLDTHRHVTQERLLSFLLDIADDGVTYENTSWRRSIVDIIMTFFDALLDSARVSADDLIVLHGLLPTQLRAFSVCFEESLIASSADRRLAILSRLLRLRQAIPSWPILPWRVLEEVLAEESGNVAQLSPSKSLANAAALVDAQMVRASLIALGLEMLASGIDISWVPVQRFQQHVALACSVPWQSPTDGITNLILPSLRAVLDSAHHLALGASSLHIVDNPAATARSSKVKTALVGSPFVPVVIDFGKQLEVLDDALTQRVILDIINVVLFKHSVRNVELATLSALQSVAEFIASAGGATGRNMCGDNRLLGMQVLHTANTRLEKNMLIRVVPTVFGTLAAALVRETERHGDMAVADQIRTYLKSVMKMFGRSTLFLQLFRNDSLNLQEGQVRSTLAKALQLVQESDHSHKSEDLTDIVFHDLSEVLKRSRDILEQVLASFCRFAEGLQAELSAEAASDFGAFISRLGKHVAEWTADEFDPNPTLRACAALLKLVNAHAATTLLHQTSTFLHLALSRFNVLGTSTSPLLAVAEKIARHQSTENTARTVLFEVTGSALHGQPVTLTTLTTLLGFLSIDAFPRRQSTSTSSAIGRSQQAKVLADSTSGCVSILLRSHPAFSTPSTDTETIISVLSRAGAILLLAETASPGALSASLLSLENEAASVRLLAYTYILLAAAAGSSSANSRRKLYPLYPIIARATSLCLRATADLLTVQDAAGDGAEMLSIVFAGLRFALLPPAWPRITDEEDRRISVDGITSPERLEKDAMESFWMRTWPDWYRLLVISMDVTATNGPLRAISHSVMLDTILYLAQIRSHILDSQAGALTHALRLLSDYQLSNGSQPSAKLLKANAAMEHRGLYSGAAVDRPAVIATIRGDLSATERLRSLRGQQS